MSAHPPDQPPPASEQRLARRQVLFGIGAVGALALDPTAWNRRALLGLRRVDERVGQDGSTLRFEELPAGVRDTHAVAPGHVAQVLVRWGDPILEGAPPFDPSHQSAASQAVQFGEGNDFIAYFPLPRGSQSSDHGVLAVNHEQCLRHMMLPPERAGAGYGKEEAAIEQAAHGLSVVEVRRDEQGWKVVHPSRYARRVTAHTPIDLSGPAAGHPRLATTADPDARTVLGTLNNCAGGWTPWGTLLTCEENVDEYFEGDFDAVPERERRNYARFGLGGPAHPWGRFFARFDADREPNEPNRFGWVVELDPYDPRSRPVKRTALGRFRHEGATCVVDPDGRVVVYSGDDSEGEFLYRFVTAGTYDPDDPASNRDLLDEGTLSVARLEEDGRLEWLPLVHGSGPLTEANGFESQADVVIEARTAASLLGATPLDRPEDVETSPVTGRVYVSLTKNPRRGVEGKPAVDAANPRAENRHGHVLELLPAGEDGRRRHASNEFRWEVLLLAGDPSDESQGARLHPDTSPDGWFSCPDNLAFDPRGRLWIATDGNASASGRADGLFACDTTGPGRSLVRSFFAVPRGAELCGPCFTPDGRSLFLAVQHPALERGSSHAAPSTRWPDFDPELPPRSAIVVVRRADGEPIG